MCGPALSFSKFLVPERTRTTENKHHHWSKVEENIIRWSHKSSWEYLSRFDSGGSLGQTQHSVSTGVPNGFDQNHPQLSQLGNSIFFKNSIPVHYFTDHQKRMLFFSALTLARSAEGQIMQNAWKIVSVHKNVSTLDNQKEWALYHRVTEFFPVIHYSGSFKYVHHSWLLWSSEGGS